MHIGELNKDLIIMSSTELCYRLILLSDIVDKTMTT
jgi:hypothetical protein